MAKPSKPSKYEWSIDKPIIYHYNESFATDGKSILAYDPANDPSAYKKEARFLRTDDDSMSALFSELRTVKIFTTQVMFKMFKRYNYLKHLAEQQRQAFQATALAQFDFEAFQKYNHYQQECRLVKSLLLESNLKLVLRVLKDLSYRGNLTLNELYSLGVERLFIVIEGFNPFYNFTFSTYAFHALRRHFYTQIKRSKDKVLFEDNKALESVKSHDIYQNDLDKQSVIRTVLQAVECLDERDKFIIRNRFFEHKTLKELGQQLGITKERVRQIEIRSLRILREALLSRSLDTDLLGLFE
jgi:RNA polymerase primary sigma factor/RNA polymerase sigma factor